ncbi:MAG: signal peptidase I [Gemmatimonadota bacterium]|nr:MAG: signal peptidase I [Gemmatimonadota bacterium]
MAKREETVIDARTHDPDLEPEGEPEGIPGSGSRRTTVGRELLEWTKTLVLTVVLAFGLRSVVVEAFVVPTGSMRPTIVEGDHLLGTKFHYWFWEPQRGDVVVFRPPDRAQELSGVRSERFVKRVVAVGGDTVEIRSGVVFVNGVAVEEPFIAEAPHYEVPSRIVPENHVFVLGDNRNESLDSHRWGFLSEESLIAHVFARYWPLRRVGGL